MHRSSACHVRLEGDGWTTVDVLRAIGELGDEVEIDIREHRDGDYLAVDGPAPVVLAILDRLPVLRTDRERMRRRLSPQS